MASLREFTVILLIGLIFLGCAQNSQTQQNAITTHSNASNNTSIAQPNGSVQMNTSIVNTTNKTNVQQIEGNASGITDNDLSMLNVNITQPIAGDELGIEIPNIQ